MTAQSALSLILLGGLVVGACAQSAEDKVTRRATSQEMPGVVDVAPTEAPQSLEPDAPVAPRVNLPRVLACDELVQSACDALGPHSDECQEVRGLAPRRFTPLQHSGCRAILDEHVAEEARPKRLNACRRLIRAACRGARGATWECKQTRKDASRLWRTGKGQVCLGDLLLIEFKRMLSEQGRGA